MPQEDYFVTNARFTSNSNFLVSNYTLRRFVEGGEMKPSLLLVTVPRRSPICTEDRYFVGGDAFELW